MDETSKWVPFGKLGRPHGVRGELRLFPFNDATEVIAELRTVRLVSPQGKSRDATVERIRTGTRTWIARFRGFDDRTAAEEWVHSEVHIPEELLAPLDDDEFYAYQLEGLQAVDGDGRGLGTVVTLTSFGAGDILVVRIAGDEVLLPFQDPYVGEIDLEAGTVLVDPGDLVDP